MLKSNLRVSRYPYKDQGQTVALVRATTTKTVQFTLKSAVKIQRRLSKNATATVSTLVQVTSDTVKCFVLVRQDTQKCGQLTKKASHTLWNANYLPYTSASANPLLRSAKAVLYELRNKVTLQFNSDDFDRTEDFIRENFGEARYRNTTVTSIEAIRSPKTNATNPIVVKVEGPAYCYSVGDFRGGVYFEITVGKSSTGVESSEISRFQQCCFNTPSVKRN